MALSTIQKNIIVALSKAGHSVKEIVEQTGHIDDTVFRVLRNFKNRGTVETPKALGRPKVLSERDFRSIMRHTKQNRRATLGEIVNTMPVKVSESTLRRSLHENGIHSRIAKKKPYLTAVHTKKRLAFAKKYRAWILEWRKILWTDEASCCIDLLLSHT